jgi:hypothetical protein
MYALSDRTALPALLAVAYQAGRCAATGEVYNCADPELAALLEEVESTVEVADAFALIDPHAWADGDRAPGERLVKDRLRSAVIYREGWFCIPEGPVLITCCAGQWWATFISYDPAAAEQQPEEAGLRIRTEPLTPERYRALAVLFYLADARRQVGEG